MTLFTQFIRGKFELWKHAKALFRKLFKPRIVMIQLSYCQLISVKFVQLMSVKIIKFIQSVEIQKYIS